MCKLRRIIHKLNIKPFGHYSVGERFAGLYASVISTKLKFIPILNGVIDNVI